MVTEENITLDNLPAGFAVSADKKATFKPIPDGTYQAEILDISLVKKLPQYSTPGNEYQFKVTLAIIEEGKGDRNFYGRRLWDNLNPTLKPTGKHGASRLYKLVTSVLHTTFSWEDCSSYASKIGDNLKQLVGAQVLAVVEKKIGEDLTEKNKVISYQETKDDLPKFDPEKSKSLAPEKK